MGKNGETCLIAGYWDIRNGNLKFEKIKKIKYL